jgi:AcrR family transcriptional regulator
MSQTEIAESRVRKGERTRTRILNAAASVLAREGYAAATLTEIAAVAKMQAGSLYYHFDSKDAIVEEVLRVGIDHARTAIREALAAVGAEASGRERLNISVEAYIKHITKDSDFSDRIIFLEPPPKVINIKFGNIKMKKFHKIMTDIWNDVCEISENYKLVNVFINRIEGIN